VLTREPLHPVVFSKGVLHAGVKRGFIPGREIVEGGIFVVNNNPLLTVGSIFLTSLLVMRSKLNKYDCTLIVR
jgi:hypothetical protein